MGAPLFRSISTQGTHTCEGLVVFPPPTSEAERGLGPWNAVRFFSSPVFRGFSRVVLVAPRVSRIRVVDCLMRRETVHRVAYRSISYVTRCCSRRGGCVVQS